MKKRLFKLFFVSLFFLASYYTVFIETKKYSSSGIIAVKNLSQEQSVSALGSLLTNVSSSAAQDSKVLELYIRSYDMYQLIDNEFNLSNYYTSNAIDFPRRLYGNTNFPYLVASHENLLKKYNNDLFVYYDQSSSTLEISYLHANASIAKKIVKKIIEHSIRKLNSIEHDNAKIALNFLKIQAEKNRQRFITAIQKIIAYQNQYGILDPNIDIQSESTLLASLQGELIKQQVKYNSQLIRKSKGTSSMKVLKKSIQETRKQIEAIRHKIAGNSKKNALNIHVFDFEILKNEADLTKELYKQTLMKLEETKISVRKKSKNITIISKPAVADMYTSPDVPNQLLSLLIVLGFIYGILYLSIMIVKSHRD